MPEQFAAETELTLTFGQLDELLDQVRDDGEAYPDEMFAAGVNYGAQHLHRAIVEHADT